MSPGTTRSWEEANQICLMAALAEVRAALENHLAPAAVPARNAAGDSLTGTATEPGASPAPSQESLPQDLEEVRASMPAPPAIDTLCATFDLTTFERRILLMGAGAELDSRFARLYSAASRDPHQPLPTFSLALGVFTDAHWSAILPARPLRYWHLLEVSSGEMLTTSPLRIDERVLHYLAGAPSIDERLRGLTEPLTAVLPSSSGRLASRKLPHLPEECEPAESHRALAEQMAAAWARARKNSRWPVVQLCGADVAGKRSIAANSCALLGLHLRVISAHAVPHSAPELDLLVRLWEREAALNPCALLLEFDEAESADAQGEAARKRLVETMRSPLLISTRERNKPVERRSLWFDVPAAGSPEQVRIWKKALGPAAATLDGKVEDLVAQFNLSPSAIHAAVAQTSLDHAPDEAAADAHGASGLSTEGASEQLAADLWNACRLQARPRMEGLAQRIEPCATWNDLVLPEEEKQLLRQIAVQVRQRNKVYQRWGFASKGSRGLGISALFAGPSGTGKTMAGEVLANELRLDLYRIDLSQVVSKYIGETEKNLRRVFDAAESGAAILLFDEADALFGKRSEVKDSHDRYANIEVGYLLQRMEAYRGLAILTTNRKEALDFAFLRRLRFVVEFPFPEAAQRLEIWRRVFPRETPTEGLRIDRLARLGAAGGNIYNIAMGAAFLAAEAGEPVRMAHLLAATRSEFTKIERPLTDAETAGWI